MYLNIVLTLLVLLILILFNIFINISNFNNNFNNKTIILNNINWVPVTTQVVPILKFDENSTMVDPTNLDEIWKDKKMAEEVYNSILLTFDSDSNKAGIQYKINTNLRYVVMKVIDNNNGGFFIHNGINYHISNFDTSNVKCMVCIIANPVGIDFKYDFKYDISKWNVSNVINMKYMFLMAEINSDINLSDWDVRNVINMMGMFFMAKINSDINLSDWDVRNVTTMNSMFYNTTIESDVTVDLLSWVTRDDVDKSFFDDGVTIVEGGSLILPNKWSTQVTLPVTTQVTLPVTTQVQTTMTPLTYGSEVLDQSNLIRGIGPGGNQNQWQSFTVGKSGILSRVAWKMSNPVKNGIPQPISLKVYKGLGTEIENLVAESQDLKTPAKSYGDGDGEYKEFDLTSNQVNAKMGDIFTMSLQLTDTTSYSGFLGLSVDNSYERGRANGNEDWDYLFKTYIKPIR